jgi:hypothetical protein
MPTEVVRGFDGPEAASSYMASPIITPSVCLEVEVMELIKVSLLMGDAVGSFRGSLPLLMFYQALALRIRAGLY